MQIEIVDWYLTSLFRERPLPQWDLLSPSITEKSKQYILGIFNNYHLLLYDYFVIPINQYSITYIDYL